MRVPCATVIPSLLCTPYRDIASALMPVHDRMQRFLEKMGEMREMGAPGQGQRGRGGKARGKPGGGEPTESRGEGGQGVGHASNERRNRLGGTSPTPSPFGSPVTHLILATGSPIMDYHAVPRQVQQSEPIFLFSTLVTFSFWDVGRWGRGGGEGGNEGRRKKDEAGN